MQPSADQSETRIAILKALQPLDSDACSRALEAADLLLEADKFVPGVVDKFLKGAKQ